MRRNIFFLSIVLLFFSGCIKRQFIDQNTTLNQLEILNNQLSGKQCQIKFADETIVKGNNIRLTIDSVYFNQEPSGINRSFEITDISRIWYRNKKRGAQKGLKYGLIGGIIAGIPLGFGIGIISNFDGNDGLSLGEAIPLGIVLGGFQWGMIGVTVGGINGAMDVIEIKITKNESKNLLNHPKSSEQLQN